MLPYLLLALYTLFCWLLYARGYLGGRLFLTAVFVPAALLLALRAASVGEDTAMYLQMADVARSMSWSSLNPLGSSIIWNADYWGYGSSVDQAFLLLLKACMALFGSSRAALMACAFATCLGFAVFIDRNSENVAQAFWAFLCGGLYMFAFNGVRQMLAIAIAINFYQFARKNRWLIAALLILVASCLHRSTLVMLGLLLVAYLLKYKWTYRIIMVGSLFLPVLVTAAYPIVSMISTQFASYYQTNYWTASAGGVVLIWALLVICALFLFFKRKDTISRFFSFCDVSYVSLALIALRMSIFERVALFCLPFSCLSFERVLQACSEKNRWWVSLVINILLFALYVSYSLSPVRTYSLFF